MQTFQDGPESLVPIKHANYREEARRVFIAALIISILFAALLTFSAWGKLRRDKSQVAVLERVGALGMAPALAALEFAAAAGLLLGLAWWPLGVAAGIGAVLYFIGAIVAHLRVGDRAIISPVVLLVVSLATVTLRLASMA